MHTGQGMQRPTNYWGSTEPDEKHGPILNCGLNNEPGKQDMELKEIITVGNEDNGGKLKTPHLFIPAHKEADNYSENKTLLKTCDRNQIHFINRDFQIMPTFNSTDNCLTIPMNSEMFDERNIEMLDERDNNLVCQDGVCGLPRTSCDCISPDDFPENLVDNDKSQKAEEPQESSKLLVNEDHLEKECPICTELYDASNHKQSLLNCSHVFCDNCIKTMVIKANEANLGRVTCPLCRQTTPMMEWEIRKMQEQMLDSGGTNIQHDYVPSEPIVRRPGLCGALEYRFEKRFRNGRLIGFPPCVRNPQRLVDRLNRLQQQCRCLYLCALLLLLFAEFFCVFFLFLPIAVFILLIVFGK